jgi:hypothetical protein
MDVFRCVVVCFVYVLVFVFVRVEKKIKGRKEGTSRALFILLMLGRTRRPGSSPWCLPIQNDDLRLFLGIILCERKTRQLSNSVAGTN